MTGACPTVLTKVILRRTGSGPFSPSCWPGFASDHCSTFRTGTTASSNWEQLSGTRRRLSPDEFYDDAIWNVSFDLLPLHADHRFRALLRDSQFNLVDCNDATLALAGVRTEKAGVEVRRAGESLRAVQPRWKLFATVFCI